jgi:DMSO/TMAO reductase YedYZ molybdopterin-dependent catalytic subunit
MKVKFALSFLIVLLTTAFIHAQILTVEGEVLKPLKLTTADLANMKTREVKAKDRDGKEHTYKGVLLAHVLDSARVTLGAKLRGENLARYILVKAVDGYEVVFSLPEIDPEFTNSGILLAYQTDGSPLPKGGCSFR